MEVGLRPLPSCGKMDCANRQKVSPEGGIAVSWVGLGSARFGLVGLRGYGRVGTGGSGWFCVDLCWSAVCVVLSVFGCV